jgi:hypothetical protein
VRCGSFIIIIPNVTAQCTLTAGHRGRHKCKPGDWHAEWDDVKPKKEHFILPEKGQFLLHAIEMGIKASAASKLYDGIVARQSEK